MPINIPNGEDIMLWSDGTWCFREELEELLVFMSDDFSEIKKGSYKWRMLAEVDIADEYDSVKRHDDYESES